jgi:hypothetical protein
VKASQLKAIRAELEQIASCYRPRNQAWSKDELQLLQDFYDKVPMKVLCEKLGRSAASIRNRAERLKGGVR